MIKPYILYEFYFDKQNIMAKSLFDKNPQIVGHYITGICFYISLEEKTNIIGANVKYKHSSLGIGNLKRAIKDNLFSISFKNKIPVLYGHSKNTNKHWIP